MNEHTTSSRKRPGRVLVSVATAAGLVVGAAGIAAAATSTTPTAPSTTPATTPAAPQAAPQGQDPAKMAHGPGETVLTGSTADKVRAAALKAVPGATIIRVETDSSGSAYEAHLQKADGSFVTVKFTTDLSTTGPVSGFGGGPAGGAAPTTPPADGSAAPSLLPAA